MEITKEYLDEQFGKINQRFEDVDKRFEAFDRRFDSFALMVGKMLGDFRVEMADFKLEIKQGMKQQKKELEDFIIQGFEHHQTWVREEFKNWMEPYDDRITKVELDVAELKFQKKSLAAN